MKPLTPILCAAAFGLGTPAIACDCIWYPEVALEKSALVADVRIGKLRFDKKDNATSHVTVVKGWKGVRTGERVLMRFDQGTSCSSGIPRAGAVMRIAAVKEGRAYWPSNCLVEITRPENQHLLKPEAAE